MRCRQRSDLTVPRPPFPPAWVAMVSVGVSGVEWAPCSACGWWDYNIYVIVPFGRPFCRRCLSELAEGRLRQCVRCGWWDWDCHDDNPVCEYCLRAMARRMRLAFPTLPESACARIVYWRLYIGDTPSSPSSSTDTTDDRMDQVRE